METQRINTYVFQAQQNKEGYDMEGLKGQVEWCSEKIDKAYKKIKEYITEREEEEWQ